MKGNRLQYNYNDNTVRKAPDSATTLQPMLDRAQTDTRVDALIVPIGKGVLLCRKR
jgi:predicted O-methyltransferase YrrM